MKVLTFEEYIFSNPEKDKAHYNEYLELVEKVNNMKPEEKYIEIDNEEWLKFLGDSKDTVRMYNKFVASKSNTL
jgi:hypothetical protein